MDSVGHSDNLAETDAAGVVAAVVVGMVAAVAAFDALAASDVGNHSNRCEARSLLHWKIAVAAYPAPYKRNSNLVDSIRKLD